MAVYIHLRINKEIYMRSFCVKIKYIITLCAVYIFSVRYLFAEKRYEDSVFVLRNDYLGDFILSLPLFASLSREVRKRGERLVILCSSRMRPFAESTGLFDDYIDASPARLETSFFERVGFYAFMTRCKPCIFLSLLVFSDYSSNRLIGRFTNASKKFFAHPASCCESLRHVEARVLFDAFGIEPDMKYSALREFLWVKTHSHYDIPNLFLNLTLVSSFVKTTF